MRFRFAPVLAVPAAVVLIAIGACSNQGEGQVCDTKNGDNDCQSGLTCQNKTGVNGARCCPPQGTPSSATECSGAPGLDANPAPPDGTATGPEASSDSAAAADGPRESSMADAPGEAMATDGGADGAGTAGDTGTQDAPGQ